MARRLILAYNRAIRIFNETYSDDIGAYIKWLSIFTWWAVIFGVGCGLLTFLPDKYVYIWILSSIPFYGYLFYSYQNYMIFYEQVERTLEIENAADDEKKELEKRLERALEDAARAIDERDGKLYAILEDTKPMAFSVI